MIERRLDTAEPVFGRVFLSWLGAGLAAGAPGLFPGSTGLVPGFTGLLLSSATTFLVPTSTISSTAGLVIVLDFSTRPVSTPSVYQNIPIYYV